MTRLIGILATVVLAFNAHASDALPACAPAEKLSIGGIGLSDSRASAMALLGKPERTAAYQGEDDGGLYTGTTMVYRQLELDVDELRGVERIASASPGTALPYGLKIGMALERVAMLLHFVPVGLRNDSVAVLPVCGALYETNVHLSFLNGKLNSVAISKYGP